VVDQVHFVRHKGLVEGRSIRLVACEMRISRNTLSRYLGELAEPRRLERPPRPQPVWERVRERIAANPGRVTALDRREAASHRETASRDAARRGGTRSARRS